MATITVTASLLRASIYAKRVTNNDGSPTIAVGAFTAGQVASKATGATKFGLCDANDTDNLIATPKGIYENSGAADQVCSIIYDDPELFLGAGGTLVVGHTLIPGITPGQIKEDGDATTGWKKSHLGINMTVDILALHLSPLPSPAMA